MTGFPELEEGQKENRLLLHTQIRLHLVIPHPYHNLMRGDRLEVQDKSCRWQRHRTRAPNRVHQRDCGQSREPA
jgi:hypothetical protein